MKKTFMYLFGMFFITILLFVISINFTGAVIKIVFPTNYSNYTGITSFNISYINGTDFNDSVNATFYYNRSGTWTFLNISTKCVNNIATVISSCNGTFPISSLTDGKYSINATLNSKATGTNYLNTSGASVITTSVIFDSTPPNVSSTLVGQISYGNYTGTLILNISANDPVMGIAPLGAVYFNITYANGSQVNFSSASSAGGYYSVSIDTTTFQDNRYNITVQVNDSLNNLNDSTKLFSIAFDKTAPTGIYSCSPSSLHTGESISCSCTPTDATSGINPNLTSATTSPSTANTGVYPLTCSFTDMAGNTGTAGTTYTIESIYIPNSAGGTSTPTTLPQNQKVTSFTQIAQGSAAIISNFNAEMGLKEIQITVNNPAQNIKVTVTKYDGKPASVSIEKTGKVYKYLQISAPGLSDKVNKTKFTLKVLKSWASSNSLDKGSISLYHFDEATSKWNELATTYKEEDSTYYYYDAESPGFSYFAIAEKLTTTEQPVGQQPTGENQTGQVPAGWSSNSWIWVILGAVIIAAIIIAVFLAKKKKIFKF